MTLNEQVGKRIAELLAARRMRQADLVQAGCAKAAHMSHIINGTAGASLPVLSAVCQALDISLAEFFRPLAEGAEQPPRYVEELLRACQGLSAEDVHVLRLTAQRMQELRRAGSRERAAQAAPEATRRTLVAGDAAAGPPLYSPALWDEEIEAPEKYADPDRYLLIRARGDSMEPRIHSGDVVVVQKDAPPENGEVALVRLAGLADDEYTIKRVYLSNGVMTLRSYNPAYPPMTYDAGAVRSCQRVVHVMGRK